MGKKLHFTTMTSKRKKIDNGKKRRIVWFKKKKKIQTAKHCKENTSIKCSSVEVNQRKLRHYRKLQKGVEVLIYRVW